MYFVFIQTCCNLRPAYSSIIQNVEASWEITCLRALIQLISLRVYFYVFVLILFRDPQNVMIHFKADYHEEKGKVVQKSLPDHLFKINAIIKTVN